MTICRVKDMSVSIQGRNILDSISLEVARGELCIIAGPNGSGKSTFLRVLCGLQQYNSGSFEVAASGRDQIALRGFGLFSRQERARCVAYVPQKAEQSMSFTVRQKVLLGRAPWQNLLGTVSAEDGRIAREVLELLHIGHLAERPFMELSGGEQQLAVIARAICQTPRLLLLDEPTSSLDYNHQMLVMEAVSLLCRERGLAVLMAAHDLNLACMYAHKVMLLKNGKCFGFGGPKQLLSGELLEEIYGCKFLVDENPCTQTPRVTMLSALN